MRESIVMTKAVLIKIGALCLLYIMVGAFSVVAEDYGSLRITSSPKRAKILINGKKTPYRTPARIKKLPVGPTLVEVVLPNYEFSKRMVNVIADTTLTISFNLVSRIDTIRIVGDLQLGILSLPKIPFQTPYLVDNKQVYAGETALNVGNHRVIWNGGNRYTSLDTIVEIKSGKITTFTFTPRRLTGILELNVFPNDATVKIDGQEYGSGSLTTRLATGMYTISIDDEIYVPYEKLITIEPNKKKIVYIELDKIPDRDRDGFMDSVDLCPDVYGLYQGCPRQKKGEALKRYSKAVVDNMRDQKFFFAINGISWLYRVPTNKRFREFISYFNDGEMFFNNYRGMTVGNSYQLYYRGLHFGIDLNQHFSSLKYKKHQYPNPLVLERDEKRYLVVYDTLAGIRPTIQLPGTALYGGMNWYIQDLTILMGMGAHFQNVKITGIVKEEEYLDYKNFGFGPYNDKIYNLTYRNIYWFVRGGMHYDINILKTVIPSVSTTYALGLQDNGRTAWHTLEVSLLLKIMKRKNIQYLKSKR